MESRSGENRRPAPISRRAFSPRSGITRTRISSRPSTSCQSSRQPGLIPRLRLTSAGIVTPVFLSDSRDHQRMVLLGGWRVKQAGLSLASPQGVQLK